MNYESIYWKGFTEIQREGFTSLITAVLRFVEG